MSLLLSSLALNPCLCKKIKNKNKTPKTFIIQKTLPLHSSVLNLCWCTRWCHPFAIFLFFCCIGNCWFISSLIEHIELTSTQGNVFYKCSFYYNQVCLFLKHLYQIANGPLLLFLYCWICIYIIFVVDFAEHYILLHYKGKIHRIINYQWIINSIADTYIF